MEHTVEHTVEAYLKRCSSEKLIRFLENCMYSNQWNQYKHAVPQIIILLHSRKVALPDQLLSSWETFIRTVSDECPSKGLID